MSFPKYPKYKASGVEWLGEVPENWRNVPLKAVATHNDEALDENTPPYMEMEYVDISSVDSVNGITSTETMLFADAPSRARRRVRHGDVIVSTVRTYLRAIACIRNPADNLIVSTGFAVVRPRTELVPSFLGHVLSASYFVEQVIARSTGVSYPAINASELVGIPVLIPSIEEQTLIASFLDRETSKLYDQMKQRITELTRSQHALKVLDTLFDRPVFQSSDFCERSGIGKNTAMPFLRSLREAGILHELREASGRRSAILVFRELLNCVEGRTVL